MRQCKYCNEEEIVDIGKDNVPVCADHYGKYLNAFGQLLEKIYGTAPTKGEEGRDG